MLWHSRKKFILAAFPGKEEGYDSAEPNEHNKYQDFGHSHWKNSLIWGIGLENITISGPGLIYGKGLTREESRLPGVGNKAISLKECRNVTLKDLSMLHCRTFRPACHRSRSSDYSESESRHKPGWIRYWLLPECTYQPMHGKLALGWGHCIESILRFRTASRIRKMWRLAIVT